MADSYVLYTAPGGQAIFSVPFPYINKAHVFVSLNGVQQLIPADYDWATDGSIVFFGAVNAGVVVKLWRQTSPDSALVQFQNGAVLTADQLNTAALQALYRTQELQDALDTYINGGIAAYSINGNNAGLTPEELIAQAASSVLSSELAADLNSRINDINENAQSILDQNTRLVDLQATVDALTRFNGTGIATYVQNETDQRIAGDTALADTVALLGAQNGSNTAFILNTSTVQVDATTTLADQLAGLISSAAANSAAIASEASTRASADSANATSISTLSTTVSGNTSTIATQASSINGLQAQYTVKVDVNGHVAGFGLASTPINGTPTSSFIVSANSFSVIDPGNGVSAPIVPFTVTGGVVYMNSVVIKDALIQNMTITKLTQGSLNADMNVGTGRIIWDNGTYMKVSGTGFGTSNQFIEWFGPHMAVSSCSEANAISYLKVNGSAYFGGSLSAGTLSTSGSTSNLASNASVTIGPYGSNGHNITVTYSAAMTGSLQNNTVGDPWGGGGSLSIALDRTIGTGAVVTVATQTLSGSANTVDNGAGSNPRYDHRLPISGSFTYTDNAAVAQNRTYTLRMTSRSENSGGDIFSVTVQTLTVISVEQ